MEFRNSSDEMLLTMDPMLTGRSAAGGEVHDVAARHVAKDIVETARAPVAVKVDAAQPVMSLQAALAI